MGVQKNIKRLLQNPREMRFKEVKNILEYFGYNLVRIRGSHHIFEDHSGDRIVFPVHNKRVTNIYLKCIKAVIFKS